MNIPFLKLTKFYYILSLILVVGALFSIFSYGFKFGIDFSGGSILELEFSAQGGSAAGGENRPDNPKIQEKLNELNLGEIIIQPVADKGVMIKMKEINETTHQQIISKLGEISPVKEVTFENIGPVVGKELREKTMILVIVSLVALLVYISISFRNVSGLISGWQYGIVSLIALTFDVLITVGLLCFLGKFYDVQFNIPIITALLTILGYTINDKVIVFDRIRENILKRMIDNFKELVDKSLNETLTRSLSTGTCTLLVLVFIFLFGGDTLKYFSLTLIVGIVVGTYSSLFLASPILVSWLKWKERKLMK